MCCVSQNNRWKKRGLSLVPTRFAIGYQPARFNAIVSIFNGDGSVGITTGGVEIGQGVHTKVGATITEIGICRTIKQS